jgi:sarcosine oxidase, subunit beta
LNDAEGEANTSVAIVGAGVTGLSIAFHLAQHGADVVVYERASVGAGASGVQPGGVRQQWSTTVNCLLARESVEFYRHIGDRLEARTRPKLEPCGYVFLAHTSERLASMVADVALQQEAGVPSRILTPAEVADIVPGASIDAVLGAAYCAEDGYFDKPQAVVEAFADACRRLGVVIEHRTILGLEMTSSGWQLRSAGSRPAQADAVVLAAGYDTPVLLDGLEVDLPMAREPRYLFFSDPIKERLLEPLVISPERQFAAKQLANGRILASDLSADGDPDRNETSWRASVREKGRELLPALEYVTYPILVEGFYDVTPDHQAVVGPVDGLDGLWLAAGFSGHGFMMAPAVGRIVADGILDRSYDPLLEAFRPERFQQGSLVPELQIV